MTRARLLLLLLLVALSLGVAGCGGSESESAGGAATTGAAEFAPAGAALFLFVNTDTESEQWHAAEALLHKFPSGDKLIARVLSELEQEGVDWETELKPALGPEVGLVALSFEESGDDFVGFTQAADPDKLADLLAEGDDPAVTEVIEGWTAFAETQEVLDRFKAERESGSLADSDAFQAATEELSGDALATLYLNGQSLVESAGASADAAGEAFQSLASSLGTLQGLALELVAEEDGVRIAGVGQVENGAALGSYEPALPSVVPADAVVYLSFNGLEDVLGSVLDAIGESVPDFDQQLGFVELALGVSLTDDVLPLFANEGALVVAPGSPIPAISLILEVDDEQAAVGTLDKLTTALGNFVDGAQPPQPTEIAGIQAKQVRLDDFSLFYAAVDGKLVVTSARDGIAGLVEDGPKLADDPAFQQARESAGMPDETIGFLYVDLKDGIQLVSDYAQLAGDAIPAEVSENLEPLQSLLVYGVQDGSKFSFSGFLGIE